MQAVLPVWQCVAKGEEVIHHEKENGIMQANQMAHPIPENMYGEARSIRIGGKLKIHIRVNGRKSHMDGSPPLKGKTTLVGNLKITRIGVFL